MSSIQTQFLTNRLQHVMVYGCRSKLVNCMSGVPLVCVLGPLLFLLYTSELYPILENRPVGVGYINDSHFKTVLPFPGVRAAVAESLNCDLGNESEWVMSE